MIDRFLLWVNLTRVMELLASILTVTGMALGSTTNLGAIFYAASMVPWWWLTINNKLWGLIPLNCASTIIIAWTLIG